MNFALIGVSGYIAPKHLKAIKELGHNLVAALDPSDSAGILDEYFPEAEFFTETERFDRYLDKHRNNPEKKINYVSICSPNFLHDAHIRMALRNGANAICEKPLVINPWNLDALEKIEEETGQRIYSILQLRYHPNIIALKKEIQNSTKNYIVEMDIQSPRGKWYSESWKGDINKSGGLITNIGIHYFDLLLFLFGPFIEATVFERSSTKATGILRFANAKVKWFLNISNKNGLMKPRRVLNINDRIIDLVQSTDLHNTAYQEILNNNGFLICDSLPSIELTDHLRNYPIN